MAVPPSAMSRPREHGEPLRPLGAGIEAHPPRLGGSTWLEGDLEPPLRDQRAKAFRPFDQRHAVAKRILDTELPALLGVAQAEAVEMPDRQLGRLINLHQRESRAGPLFPAPGAGADKGAGKACLAGAELALQRDDIAAPGKTRQARGKSRRGGFVRPLDNGHDLPVPL